MAPGTTRSYTYVDIIREIRQERSAQATIIAREALELGLSKKEALELAAKVAAYELTPEQARAKLRELAGRDRDGSRVE